MVGKDVLLVVGTVKGYLFKTARISSCGRSRFAGGDDVAGGNVVVVLMVTVVV